MFNNAISFIRMLLCSNEDLIIHSLMPEIASVIITYAVFHPLYRIYTSTCIPYFMKELGTVKEGGYRIQETEYNTNMKKIGQMNFVEFCRRRSIATFPILDVLPTFFKLV